MSVSCAFSWAPFLFAFLNISVLVFVFILFYPLEAYLFSNKRQERGGSGWEGRCQGEVEEREIVIRLYYARGKKRPIFNKRKKQPMLGFLPR